MVHDRLQPASYHLCRFRPQPLKISFAFHFAQAWHVPGKGGRRTGKEEARRISGEQVAQCGGERELETQSLDGIVTH